MLRVRARLEVGDLSAPPGNPVSPGDAAAQALFLEARRRRRRRWLAGIAAVLVAAAVVAISAVTWLPRVLGQGTDSSGAAGPALAGRSSAAAWDARITDRVVTAGVLDSYGTGDVRFSGKNWNSASSWTQTARGTEPAQTHSDVERYVDGQAYDYDRVDGRMQWVHDPFPAPVVRIRDPRNLLGLLEPFTGFQATGYQVIGGARLTVLRATDPGRLTRRALLPAVFTSGQPVTSLEVWVDRQHVVHRMAFTFRATGVRIALPTPVSEAALRKYRRADRAWERTLRKLDRYHARTGKRIPERPIRLAQRRLNQAFLGAYQVLRGAQVTTTTVTFSAIGQPQQITAPQHAISSG
jgi:hypothetical protein